MDFIFQLQSPMFSMTNPKYILCFLILLLSPLSVVRADFIYVVSATSSDMTDAGGSSLNETFNGEGLSPGSFPSFTALHDPVAPDNSWRANEITGEVTFDLGSIFDVIGFSFWNANDGDTVNGDTGISGVTITASTDGNTFSPILGAPTSFSKVTTSPAIPEQFTFASPVSAQFIRFQIVSNHGGSATGFAEVAFNDNTIAAVPEPSSVLLVAGSITLAASYRRWRRKNSNSRLRSRARGI
jgi:hypothetical protein